MSSAVTSLVDPARQAFVVTPDNATDLKNTTRGVWVGGAGNLNVDMANGDTVLFSGIAAGTFLPIQVKRIRSTSTTATLIVALV